MCAALYALLYYNIDTVGLLLNRTKQKVWNVTNDFLLFARKVKVWVRYYVRYLYSPKWNWGVKRLNSVYM